MKYTTLKGGNVITITKFGEENILSKLTPTGASRTVQIKSVTSSEDPSSFTLKMYHFNREFELKNSLAWNGTAISEKEEKNNIYNFNRYNNIDIELQIDDKLFVEMFTTKNEDAIPITISFL